MKRRSHCLGIALLAWGLASYGQAQSTAAPNSTTTQAKAHKHSRSAGGEIGSGSGDVAKGAAKGTGNVAAGAGKGAVDLATLHPVQGATDIGKGGVAAGKDVGVGAVKGTGRIAKGTGKAIRKIL